jgi:DNA-binding transcriptional regulator GbsR (MarR family)
MPEIGEDGLFVGLSRDDKATAVLEYLAVDREITLQELASATGLSVNQIHTGIRHLREAKPDCVVTYRRGAGSAYKLAENAPEVRDYALRRMQHWQTQISVMHKEMETATRLLPGAEAVRVRKAAKFLATLLEFFELDEEERREYEKKDKSLARREEKVRARSKRRTKVPA